MKFPILEVRGSYSELRFASFESKSTHDFPITVSATFCYICRSLTAIPVSSYGPPIRPQFGGQGGPRRSKMVPIEISPTHSCSTPIHTIGLSCTVWPQHITRQIDDRQSDWNRPPICYCIGSLKNKAPIADQVEAATRRRVGETICVDVL